MKPINEYLLTKQNADDVKKQFRPTPNKETNDYDNFVHSYEIKGSELYSLIINTLIDENENSLEKQNYMYKFRKNHNLDIKDLHSFKICKPSAILISIMSYLSGEDDFTKGMDDKEQNEYMGRIIEELFSEFWDDIVKINKRLLKSSNITAYECVFPSGETLSFYWDGYIKDIKNYKV